MTLLSLPVRDIGSAGRSFPTFNAAAALERMEGNRQLLPRMVGLFAMQWRGLWTRIAQAVEYRDGPTLQLTANKLKLSLESFGATEVSRVAQELEHVGSKCHFDDAAKNSSRLKVEIERLVAALKTFANQDCE